MRAGAANDGLVRVRQRHEDDITRLGWDELERQVAEHYRAQGYAVDDCGTADGQAGRSDGGIDLRVRRGEQRLLVQVKHWNAYKVVHNEVHQLLGLVVTEDATGGVLISSGEFTTAARDAAQRLGLVQLVDGVELRRMLGMSPDPSLAASPTSSPTKCTGTIAARDGSRYGDAARPDTWPSHRRDAADEPDFAPMLAKLAATVLALLLLAHMFQTAIDGVRKRGASPARPQPVPAAAHVLSHGVWPGAPGGDAPGFSTSDDVAWPDGTASAAWDGASDLGAWRRGHAESMRTLAATTPELTRGPRAVAP